MTKTLTGKQVLALLAQDDVPEIEIRLNSNSSWVKLDLYNFSLHAVVLSNCDFRIKPTQPRRLSVTLANGEVVSWPEPVREALKRDTGYFFPKGVDVEEDDWSDHRLDAMRLAAGVIHMTREAAQEHADDLKKINTQGVTC